jgi:hypothetical protein
MFHIFCQPMMQLDLKFSFNFSCKNIRCHGEVIFGVCYDLYTVFNLFINYNITLVLPSSNKTSSNNAIYCEVHAVGLSRHYLVTARPLNNVKATFSTWSDPRLYSQGSSSQFRPPSGAHNSGYGEWHPRGTRATQCLGV